MSLEKIRVSKQARDQLVTLKRRTGIQNWNVLCRWGLCVSLAEPNPPRIDKITGDSSVEMTWYTFAGEFDLVFIAMLRERCHRDGLEVSAENIAEQFRLHLHRGIGYLAGDPSLKSIGALIGRAVATEQSG